MTYDEIFITVKKIGDELKNSFEAVKNLSLEELNWKPSADSWSAAECLQHLVTTDKYYLKEFRQIIEWGKKAQNTQIHKPTYAGKFIFKAVNPETMRKVKTAAAFDPLKSGVSETVIDDYRNSLEKIASFTEKLHGTDLNKNKIRSPFAKFLKYNLGDSLLIIYNHDKRHFEQIGRVLNSPGFPKK